MNLRTNMTAAAVSAVVAGCGGASSNTAGPAAETAVHVALLVRLEAKAGREAELEQLLAGGLPIVEDEPDTRYWFALKLAPSTFGIFDAFPDDPARQAHLAGKLAQALLAKAPEVLAKDPEIIPVDVLARKDAKREAVHVGLLVRMEAKPEHAADVAGMLEQGAGIVAKEPGTSVWFGVRLSPTTFAIFDAFADDTARKAHLGGELAKALIANADTLLATPFSLENADVLAAKIPR